MSNDAWFCLMLGLCIITYILFEALIESLKIKRDKELKLSRDKVEIEQIRSRSKGYRSYDE